MVSPVLNEQFYTAGFLVSEMPGTASREVVTFDNTTGLIDLIVGAGTIFSLQSYGTPIVTPKAGNTGNGAVSAVSPNTTVTELGAYVITMLTATTFSVTAPDGTMLNNGSSAAPYLDGIGFKFTAGGTPNAVGDTYTVTVATGVPPVVAAGGSNVGNGTIGSVETVQQATAMLGNYLLTFTASNAFNVIAPDGRQLSSGIVGTPYEDELGFTITAGGTPYVAGDAYTIGVGQGQGYATFWTGASPAAGIIYNRAYVPAGGSKQVTAIVRNAEVNAGELLYFPAGTPGINASAPAQLTAAAQLRQLGIIPR